MLFKLALKNVITKKSSYVIILFMAFAVFLFCMANAIFDTTENGVQNNYIASFTGDLVIRPKGGQNSLFGDETPVTGALTKQNLVTPYIEILNILNNNSNINSYTGHLSGLAAMEFNGYRKPMYVFGVETSEYFNLMQSVHIIEGCAFEPGQKGLMISDTVASGIGAGVGDTIQFVVADGPYIRIRAAPVTGIYKYEIDNAIFERFVLCDPSTVRSLLDISDTQIVLEDIEESKTVLLDDDLDLDSLFDEAFDTEAVIEESNIEDSEVTIEEPKAISASWNNLILRLNKGSSPKKVQRKLNRIFRKNEWSVEATDWRHAAGSTALYLNWMRKILNAGIFVILFAGFIIINNTLIVNVLDRTREIGTLRAIGAKKRFISAQCMIETLIMALTSLILGVILGFVAAAIINKIGITFTNSFIIQLFGAEAFKIFITGKNILKLFAFVMVLSMIGWIYPVLTAVKITPVKAMQGGK